MRIYGQQVSKGQAHGILDRFAYSQVTEDFWSHILSSGSVFDYHNQLHHALNGKNS